MNPDNGLDFGRCILCNSEGNSATVNVQYYWLSLSVNVYCSDVQYSNQEEEEEGFNVVCLFHTTELRLYQ